MFKVTWKIIIALGCFWVSGSAFGISFDGLPVWREVAGLISLFVAINYLDDAETLMDELDN